MTNQLDCGAVREFIPWWWNGKLEPAEAEAVDVHLEGCARCREESERVAEEAGLFGVHVPAAVLVTHAAGESTPVPRVEIEDHLAECRDCSQELELVRARRPQTQVSGDLHGSPQAATRWRTLALAAALIAAVGLVGWLASWRQAPVLRARVDAAAVNVAVAELLPQEMLLRGGVGQTQRISVPPQTERVTLALAAPTADLTQTYQVELVDADGARIWRATGLRAQPPGRFTVSIAVPDLTPGVRTLRVYAPGRDAPIATYRFELASGS